MKKGFPFACHFILDNEDYTAFDDESEVLFNDGTCFEI
jgi:hypothetical protein